MVAKIETESGELIELPMNLKRKYARSFSKFELGLYGVPVRLKKCNDEIGVHW